MSGRVFVVGSVNADLVLHLPHLPVAGETVPSGTFIETGGGKGANRAVAAARLGRPTTLVAAVGVDVRGQAAVDELAAEGVDVNLVARKPMATGVALIFVAADGENMIGLAPGANALLEPSDVEAGLVRLDRGDIILADLEVGSQAVLAAAKFAKDRGATFILNPAPARPLSAELVTLCDVMTPNAVEVTGLGFGGPSDLLAAGARLLVVTRGSEGAEVHRAGSPMLHAAAFPAAVVDTTGAGDAFTAGLGAALSLGEPPEVAVRWATAAGALATRGLGARAGYPTANELAHALADTRHGRVYSPTGYRGWDERECWSESG
jgi:ribokinase